MVNSEGLKKSEAGGFVTNPNWSKAAKVSPLPEEEVLKFR